MSHMLQNCVICPLFLSMSSFYILLGVQGCHLCSVQVSWIIKNCCQNFPLCVFMEQIYKDTCLKDFHVPIHLQQLCRSSQANSWGGRRFGKPSLALRGAFVGLRLQWGAAHLAPRGPPGSTGGRRRSARGWGPISWAADAWVAAGWEGEKWGDWMLKIFIIYF